MTEDQKKASKRKVKSNPRTPKTLITKVKKAMELTTKEEILTEDNHENDASVLIEIDEKQLHALIDQNKSLKTDIGELIGLFQIFTPLLSGKGMMGLMAAIPKLINDPAIAGKVESLMPIIDKYSVNQHHEQ